MIFNLASVFDWQVITTRKHQKFDIDNVRKIAKQVRHNYKVDYLVYVDMTGIYQKLDHRKYGPYRIICFLQTVHFDSTRDK